jgi:hypothetical protein
LISTEIEEITKTRTQPTDDIRGRFAGSLETRIPRQGSNPLRLPMGPSSVGESGVAAAITRWRGESFRFLPARIPLERPGVMEIQVAAGESQMPKPLVSEGAWIWGRAWIMTGLHLRPLVQQRHRQTVTNCCMTHKPPMSVPTQRFAST